MLKCIEHTLVKLSTWLPEGSKSNEVKLNHWSYFTRNRLSVKELHFPHEVCGLVYKSFFIKFSVEI